MKNKNKKLMKYFLVFYMCFMITPIAADKNMSSGSDLSIKIQAPDNAANLPSIPDDGTNDSQKPQDDITGKLPATGQSSFYLMASCMALGTGTLLIFISRKEGNDHENA